MTTFASTDPHAAGELLHAGTPVDQAGGALILLHGRGASAHDIMSLAPAFGLDRIAYLAPQAAGHTWYPQSFLAPREVNEPWLTSALNRVEQTVRALEHAGIPRQRVALCGFSQGACLASEFVASHPARYGTLVAFTGGLVGPLGTNLAHDGDLAGTPVLLSSGDPDPHVPWSRVQETEAELRRMGAQVQSRRHAGRPHTVTAEEIHDAGVLLEQAFR